MASTAAQRVDGLAEGNPCCVCPLCRAITALRDPSPEFAERLAAGAADFAAGLTSLLRSVAEAGATAPADGAQARQSAGEPGPASGGDARPAPADAWRTATRDADGPPPTPMAKKAVRKPIRRPVAEPRG
nr:hypothetical protein [Pilimelia terevasa]